MARPARTLSDDGEDPAGLAARLLRGRRSRRADGRARPRAPRRARVRPQGDRPQQARGLAAARPRRRVRGRRARGPHGRGDGVLRPRRGAQRARQRGRARPAHHRRDLPAGDQGPQGGPEVRPRRLHDRPRRPRRPRGGRGHDGRGARAHRPGRDRGGRGPARDRQPGQGRLHLADHAVGGRDARHHRPPARAFPQRRRAPHRRHLLRDHEPADGGQAARRPVRPRAGHRLAQLLQLPAPRRRHPRARDRGAPDRPRGPGGGELARGQARPGHHLGRERPRGPRAAPDRLLSRPRHRRGRRARGHLRGCALHAPEDDPQGAGGPRANR